MCDEGSGTVRVPCHTLPLLKEARSRHEDAKDRGIRVKIRVSRDSSEIRVSKIRASTAAVLVVYVSSSIRVTKATEFDANE